MDLENNFKNWLESNLTEGTGSYSSYISALDWLSKIYFKHNKIIKKSIFLINDIDVISKLYDEALRIQKDENSYIFNKDSPSYGKNGYFSASLRKYKEFLLSLNSNPKASSLSYSSFQTDLHRSELIYSNLTTSRFVASLLTKPFVILTGLSGSGKTKLAQAFVQWICSEESQYRIIPVGADWTNREPLLGYPNALDNSSYVKPENGVLDLILEAAKNPGLPYFLVLDEMNLSHVERYFADFLSAMESEEPVPLHSSDEINEVPKEIKIPKNLFIIGTVNIDETTHMFSPKVLDRANTIEFRISQEEMESFLESFKPLNMDALIKGGIGMAESFIEDAADLEIDLEIKSEVENELLNFFDELSKTGTEFGYRTAGEILRLLTKLKLLDPEFNPDHINMYMDFAIMQKLLPKLHGSRRKLSRSLEKLAELCCEGIPAADIQSKILEKEDYSLIEIAADKIKYPLSLEKIYRMYRSAIQNGFTSYAEA